MNTPTDLAAYMQTLGRDARAASRATARAGTREKNAALSAIHDALVAARAEVLAANARDLEAGRAAGLAYLERKHRRRDRSPEVSEISAATQLQAIAKSNEKVDGVLDYLAEIHHPALVVHGNNDLIIPTVNGFTLQQRLPNAQLILYPDANHGSFYQYPELFVKHATIFLDA